LTRIVIGCRRRKAASAATARNRDGIVQLPPAKSPIRRGLRKKAQAPWSEGSATLGRKIRGVVIVEL
jgi:hypothetical protein